MKDFISTSKLNRLKPDILVLEENKLGKDYIIGDVHGSHSLLEKLLTEKIHQNDRLFIVGDLVDNRAIQEKDKSSDLSGEVVELIVKVNQARYEEGLPQQIYVARGNHEDMFINMVNVGCSLANANIDDSQFNAVFHASKEYKRHMCNGGGWDQNYKNKNDKDGMLQIYNFLNTLPYIIYVKGKDPFFVVHADMPLNDKALLRKIKRNDLSLTDKQTTYATWARESKDYEKSTYCEIKKIREANSIIAYCGHTIWGGVRKDTNMINLDIGAFQSNAFALVAHNNEMGTCELFTGNDFNKLDWQERRKYTTFCDRVQSYLNSKLTDAYLERSAAKKIASFGIIKSLTAGLKQNNLTPLKETVLSKIRHLI